LLRRLANASPPHSKFSGDIAILKKYLKSKGIDQDALDELTACAGHGKEMERSRQYNLWSAGR
jgi:hypothetical protein